MQNSAKISLIAAVADNGVIGTGEDMPWKIKSELKYFRQHTLGKPVIMGRKTFDTLGGKPLKDRLNIVVTRDASWARDGVTVAHSLEGALDIARKTGAEEIMVIGGAEIYAQSLPLANRLYITEIHCRPEGSVRFPAFDKSAWRETRRERHKAEEGETADYSVTVLDRES